MCNIVWWDWRLRQHYVHDVICCCLNFLRLPKCSDVFGGISANSNDIYKTFIYNEYIYIYIYSNTTPTLSPQKQCPLYCVHLTPLPCSQNRWSLISWLGSLVYALVVPDLNAKPSSIYIFICPWGKTESNWTTSCSSKSSRFTFEMDRRDTVVRSKYTTPK